MPPPMATKIWHITNSPWFASGPRKRIIRPDISKVMEMDTGSQNVNWHPNNGVDLVSSMVFDNETEENASETRPE